MRVGINLDEHLGGNDIQIFNIQEVAWRWRMEDDAKTKQNKA
jgi:hypothetical protein